jgi:exodeoxyribonuclease-5
MQWSPQQDEALRSVDAWLRSNESQVFRVFGYAGTGKTTLARHFAQSVAGDVYFGAYTGKATKVLRDKGCPNANTIHSMIYIPRHKSKKTIEDLEAELKRLLKAESANPRHIADLRERIRLATEDYKQPAFELNWDSKIQSASLIVIDECSMVDEKMGEDLESFGIPILVLGDPAQLKPVRGGGHFTSQEPDVMLTEVHRQAEDNPIIHMATRVREGRGLPTGVYGESAVWDRGTDMSQMVRAADQVLAGRNKTRHAANRRIRQILGRESSLPEVSDRLVCLRNNHEAGLLNGAIYVCDEAGELIEDDTRQFLFHAHPEDCEQAVAPYTAWTESLGGNMETVSYWERKEAEEFDYGYCLTCHKSQGSQWDHVAVMDESACFRGDAKNWLYTAITRAAERVDVVKM